MNNTYTKSITSPLIPLLALVLSTTNVTAKNENSNKPTQTSEWYIRLTVESPTEQLKDKGNVLGHLKGSEHGYDKHDLLELDPFTAPYLTLIYSHPDWEDHAGNYSSDYHPPSQNKADQWQFQVKTDDINREVTLYWDTVTLINSDWNAEGKRTGWTKQQDPTALISRMWLEDINTGEKIDAEKEGQLQSYTFNMSGENVRTFRWVLNSKGGQPPKSKKAKTTSTEYIDLPSENAKDRLHNPPGHDR